MTDTEKREVRRSHIWKRDPLDWYVEPSLASEALFQVERFHGAIWDPACGGGNIVRAARSAGYLAWGSDIKCRLNTEAEWFVGERDFLAHDQPYQNIVCNPPFYRGLGTENFIRRALERTQAKVCIFANLMFLAGHSRSTGIYSEHPPHRVWIVTPRVSCPPGEYLAAGGKPGNGTDDWVWMVWDQTAPRAVMPTLGWLRTKPARAKKAKSAPRAQAAE